MPNCSWLCSSLNATEFRASLGHLSNQIMVHPLIIEGNCLHLFLNLFPTGEKDITKWRFYFIIWIKSLYMFSGESCRPFSLMIIRISLYISSKSSKAMRLGTSPLLTILFMSSKKLSYLMLLSERINTVDIFLDPVYLSNFLRSSFQVTWLYEALISMLNIL